MRLILVESAGQKVSVDERPDITDEAFQSVFRNIFIVTLKKSSLLWVSSGEPDNLNCTHFNRFKVEIKKKNMFRIRSEKRHNIPSG